MYASSRADKNVNLFLDHLLHILFGKKRSKAPAQLVHSLTKDAVFIPSGWDTRNKIAMLTEGFVEHAADAPFNEIIKRPAEASRPAGQAAEEDTEDEQSFLQRILQKQASGDATPAMLESIKDMDAAAAAAAPAAEAARPRAGPTGSPSLAATSAGGADGSGAAKGNFDTEQLQQFFTGLLKKPAGVSRASSNPLIRKTTPDPTQQK